MDHHHHRLNDSLLVFRRHGRLGRDLCVLPAGPCLNYNPGLHIGYAVTGKSEVAQAAGLYSFVSLHPGNYRMPVKNAGFKEVLKPGLVPHAGGFRDGNGFGREEHHRVRTFQGTTL